MVEVTPSWRSDITIVAADKRPDLSEVDAIAVPVAQDGDVPDELAVGRAELLRAGFSGEVGQALAFPRSDGPALVAVGVGDVDALDASALRRAAAAFARAVPNDSRLATQVRELSGVSVDSAAAAIVEGVLLARYRFDLRSVSRGPAAVSRLVLYAPEAPLPELEAGTTRGRITARAALLGRDLANCPAGFLTADRMAEVAVEVGADAGLKVEVFDRDDLAAMGCGGLLGVNKGSVNPPRMIRLRYAPEGQPLGRLTLVGKGVMYDSGGISLKPSDVSHSQMKNDMSGAGAVLAAMSVLHDLGCPVAVTGYLMCTDNMPSGSAIQLGDVLTMRGGKTVEVLNTDAEGRLVMADALAMATEEPVDAIVDIATLTGACLRTFGTRVAGVLGNHQGLVEQVEEAGAAADEPVWQLPLIPEYRTQLDSEIADLTNMGGPNAGSITAALFLEEFVAGHPWAHIDIAGTAQSETAEGWLNKGATGAGTRLLIELAMGFTPPNYPASAN
jgi:leucyl aminopeptidase